MLFVTNIYTDGFGERMCNIGSDNGVIELWEFANKFTPSPPIKAGLNKIPNCQIDKHNREIAIRMGAIEVDIDDFEKFCN